MRRSLLQGGGRFQDSILTPNPGPGFLSLGQRLFWNSWSDGSLEHSLILGIEIGQRIIGAKLPQPPHNTSYTPLPHSPQFTKVHQLKFPLHYMSERRIFGTLEQNCPNLHITILLFLSLTAYSAPNYTNYNFHFTTCRSKGSLEHWSKIAPTST